jgi:hypothetical protein
MEAGIDTEVVSADVAVADAAKHFASSTPSTVSARTARRQKRAARRARIAEAARRAAQVDAQAVAARVRASDEARPHESQMAVALPVSAPVAKQPAQKRAVTRPGIFRQIGSSLAAWNTRLNRWAARKSTNKPRGKRLFQIGLVGIALLVVAEVIGELAPAHVVHVAFGFMGMLFIDIALGLGLYLLLVTRGLVGARPAWAQSVINSWSSLTRRSG